ncbi:MAG: Fe-S cluster assembly ATPase SufC [Candidatus Altiarchaeales archaeon]|nr:Fe-S cluster assembly ATPase SufC [Candidatus Altiarchaeota archaeon]MBU4341371.1 Fe-S cluster assembly ATPase SufC [Candidatus Altiarchaeota archaeon]MBU4436836.1 Fe-S cluster assembly ATPase SufC [Candidatus Altiarchaeota archaeon]MCG2782979.1 Fe-S cluster assembly ATPase SufC [Candidatus Altiarchaeales archaeon]
MNVLEVKDLRVTVEDKVILNGVDMEVGEGQVNVLFGPNGSGKTSLMMSIVGLPGYKIKGGKILFKEKNIASMDVNERVKLGIGVAFQLPPEIVGVKLRDMLKICAGKKPDEELGREELKLVEKFRMTEFLDRDINLGFSGGEKKRAEILQLLLMKPKLLLMDEPDSGVDIESLRLISKEIQDYLESSGASALIITHQGEILENIEAEHGCVMLDGKVMCQGKPKEILKDITEKGYRKCVSCRERMGE